MTDSSGESSTEMHPGVQELYDTFWSHDWSTLTSEQEREIERAFEIVQAVHDEMDGGRR